MSWIRRILFGPDSSMIPSPDRLRWDRRKAAISYFILQHLRDQRLPREVHFHPEDFLHNAVLNEMAAEAGLKVPPPADTNRYIRDGGVTEWFPRYFPDRDGGDFIVSAYKAELVSAVLLSQAKFLRAVAEKYTVPFPMKPDYFNDLRPGHVCFVKYG